MRIFAFIYELFRKFPLLLIINTLLLIATSLFAACSLFTISPVVDFLVHPDLQGISPMTAKAIDLLNFVGLPVSLISWLIVFLIFIILSSIFQIFAKHTILKTTYAVIRQMLLGTFEDFFNARWHFFSSGRQGVLLNTFTRELIVVSDAFGAVSLFFAAALQALFFLAIPFYISWQVAVVSICVACLFAIPFSLVGKLSYKLGTQNTSTSNKVMSIIHENFSLAKVVLGFGNQNKNIDNLGRAFDAHRKVALKSRTLNVAIPILYRPLGIVMIVAALVTARKFNVPLSEIVVLLVALERVAVSVGELMSNKNSLENFTPSYEQVKALRTRAAELKQKSGSIPFKGFKREIRVEGLFFAYPGHDMLLNDINVRIPKGNMIAFVGESGSGKSTFVDLIMGFHELNRGHITFDDVPLWDFNVVSYRRRIGYVPQDSVLFNVTIKDNLLWAHESATESDIVQACKQANADEFIKQLPQGYNTPVGDRGVRLSGGQIQRIALARAILRKPELLILDEATSSLDTYSERLIQEAIENIARETTVIVIAHRLSTIANADYIYVLKQGRIAEEGRHQDLIRENGYFNNMVKLQALGVEE